MSIPRNLSKLAEGTDSSGILGIAYGGTGGSSQADAKAALGLHAVATSGSYSDLLNKPTTANIIENTNLYFTDARARASVSASGSLSYNSATGVFSYTTPSTSGISEGTNLYYTDARARGALSASTGISYNSTTGAISTTITQYTDTLARGAVSASGDLSYNSTTGVFSYTTPSTSGIVEGTNLYFTDARARASISVTGAGSYNSTTGVINIVGGVTSFNTRTGAITLSSADVTGALGFTPYNSTNPSGYLTGITSSQVTTALGFTPYNATNPNGYITGITSSNVTTALGFTPYNATNPSGYISGITSGMVTTALGYTPYNSSNPSGYITSAALSSYLPLSGGTLTGDLRLSTIRDISGIWILGKYGSEISLGSAGALNDIRFNSLSAAAFEYRGNSILHAGNYSSYALPLSGGTVTGHLVTNHQGNGSPSITVNTGGSENWRAISVRAAAGNDNFGIGYSNTSRSVFGRNNLSFHCGTGDSIRFHSDGWDTMFEVAGATGNAWLKGGLGIGVIPDVRLSVNGDSHLVGILNLGGTAGSVGSWGSRDYTTSGNRYFNANSYNFDNYGYGSNWSFTLSSGIGQASASLRAPIFYDSNDTSYQVDPNGGTALKYLRVDGNWGGSPYGSSHETFTVTGSYASMAQRSTIGNQTYVLHHIDDRYSLYIGRGSTNGSDWNWALRAYPSQDGNYVEFRTSARAPIFYDLDNTGYYTDPASTSRLNAVHANYYLGEITDSGNGDSNAPFRFESDYSGWVSLLANSPGAGNGWGTFWAGNDNAAYTYFGSSNPNEYVFVGAGGVRASIDLDNGQSYFGTSVRSPTFYDSNDTGNYLTMSGLSNINALSATRIGVNPSGSSSNGFGISLYSGYSSGEPTYGLMFQGTGTFGSHGGVNSDWATYFTMNNDANRGWIFRNVGTGPVASITANGRMSINSHFEQGNNYAHPNIEWSASGGSTGEVIFYLPGTTANYGMVHMVFDIYEYVSGKTATVTIGGHNWANSWYETACDVVGYTDKQVRLGTKDGRFVVVFGTSSSSWSYGTIRLRKIHNGSFYNDIMNMVGNWEVVQSTSGSFSNISGDLRALRTSTDFTAFGSVRSPIFYDSSDTNYYVDPTSTSQTASRIRGGALHGPNSSWGSYLLVGGDGRNGYYNNGSVASVCSTNGNLHLDAASGFATYINYYDGDLINFGNGADGIVSTINSDGSHRPQIVYDYNNTGYYLDPNSTSYLNQLILSGTYYFRPNNWIQMDSAAGIFWNNHYGAHLEANTGGGYTQIKLRGSKNSYSGIWDEYSAVNIGMFDSAGNGGVYREANGKWQTYYHMSNDCMGIGTSSTNSAYGLYCNKGAYFGGRVDGTIFYDTNNTGYYCDPASTSYVNSLQATGLLRSNTYLYLDQQYGSSIVGAYSSTRYQGVFAMGDAYKLPIDGTSAGNLYGIAWSYPSAGGVAGNLDSHGMLVLINGGFGSCMSYSIKASSNITAYSDERLKTNWRDMPENFVDRLSKVKVGIYDRIDGEKITQVGVSAQSLQELLPQAIETAKDEIGTLSVSYGNAALASSVELAKEVVDLKARVAQLEALIEKLIKE